MTDTLPVPSGQLKQLKRVWLCNHTISDKSLRKLPGLAEENVVNFDGFADNLAKTNDSSIHYLLSNPAYELIVQLFL